MKAASVAALFLALMQPVQRAHAWGGVEHHDPHWTHENPVVVHNVYTHHDSGGCIGCGIGIAAVAGLVGGAILGAALSGSSNSAPPPDYQAPPPAYEYPPQAVMVPPAGPPIGSEVSVLPPGCQAMNVNGATYYQCGPIWYQPFFGGNGVYYTVVPTP